MADLLLEIEGLLGRIISASITEAADEKKIQLATAKSIKSDRRSLNASDNDKSVKEAEEDEAQDSSTDDSGGDMSKRPVSIPEKLPAAITLDMVIDGIDAIRSARSLKKPEVRAEFEEYFNSLSSDEKVGLLAFVYGIAETLIGNSPGRGLDPSEEPYNVQMSSDPEQDAEASKVTNQRVKTDSGDTPIVVGG